MSFPIDEVRAATPGAELVAHLNNAGAALPPQVVIDTVVAHLRREAEMGGYEAARAETERIEGVYDSIARLIGADRHEIAIVENATRAWDMAVYAYPFQPGDRVLVARAEYASNAIALLQLQRQHDIQIVLIEDDRHGQIDLDHLRAELEAGAAMVSLTHVPTNGGLVNPAADVGALCRAHDVCFVLDACQSAGQIPLDVRELGCDVLSATSRKYLRGPRGVGFLYVREPWIQRLEPPLLDLHAAEWTSPNTFEIRRDARRFETWETSYANRLGLGAAIDYALDVGVDAGWQRLESLAAGLRDRLRDLSRVDVHDKGAVQGGIVTFSVHGHDADAVAAALRSAGVNTSTTTPNHSHFDGRNLAATIRASAHYYNTEHEIDRLVDVVRAR